MRCLSAALLLGFCASIVYGADVGQPFGRPDRSANLLTQGRLRILDSADIKFDSLPGYVEFVLSSTAISQTRKYLPIRDIQEIVVRDSEFRDGGVLLVWPDFSVEISKDVLTPNAVLQALKTELARMR